MGFKPNVKGIEKGKEVLDALKAVADAHNEFKWMLNELFATGDAYGPGNGTGKWVAENWARIRDAVMPDFDDSE